MKNKSRSFFLMATLALWGLLSCTTDDNSYLQNDEIVNSNMTEMECITQMASTLNEVISDPDILSFLREEASKKIDGDFNVLLAHAMENTTPTKSGLTLFELIKARLESSATRSSSNSDFAQFVEIFKKNAPLLSLYMPDWQDFDNDADFYTVILDPSFEDGADSILSVFNNKGELIELVVENDEPEVPYMVIGINERIMIDTDEGTKSNGLTPIFTTEYHSYYLPTKYKEVANLPVQSPGISQMSIRSMSKTEYITRYQFTTYENIRAVEGWYRGQPEVHLIILSLVQPGPFNGTNCQQLSFYLDVSYWYTPAGSGVIRYLDRTLPGTPWEFNRAFYKYYIFTEEDNRYRFTLNEDLTYSIRGGDNIGNVIVYYSDPIDHEYYTNTDYFKFCAGQ